MQIETRMQFRPVPRHAPSPPAVPAPVRTLVHAVARAFQVREGAIIAEGRTGAREALARHAAMYLAHVSLGWSYGEVAGLFRRHRTSVRYACARVEDRRDDPRFDVVIARLERRFAVLRGERA